MESDRERPGAGLLRGANSGSDFRAESSHNYVEGTMGRTPRINETEGRAVLQRMTEEGLVASDVNTRGTLIYSTDPATGESGWYPIEQCQMAHRTDAGHTDAVHWWNNTGRFFDRPGGRPAPEVRAWMRKSENYVIQYHSQNEAGGAALTNAGVMYLPPVPPGGASH
jgi:hypothetical protein